MLTKEQVLAELSSRKAAPKAAQGTDTPVVPDEIKLAIEAELTKRNLEKGNEFTRGVVRGARNTASLIGEGVPAVAKGVVNDVADFLGQDAPVSPQENLERYQEQTRATNTAFPTRYQTFEDVKDVGSALGYVAGAAGEQVPQLGMGIFSGGTGAIVAKAGASALAKRAGVELTKQAAGKALERGILAGTVASSAGQNIPETYFNLLDAGQDAGVAAVMVGGLKSSLDILPQMRVLEKVLGPQASEAVSRNLLKRVGKEAVISAGQEGATESAQEGIDMLAEQFIADNQDVFNDEGIVRLIDAGLKGAIGGGLMGAGAAPLMGPTDKGSYETLSPKDKAKVDAQFAETVIDEKVGNSRIYGDLDNPTDDTIVSPTYVQDERLVESSDMGLNNESLNILSQPQLDKTLSVIDALDGANSLTDAFNAADMSGMKPQLTQRNAAVKAGKRTDTDFVPGDGEIVKGVTLNPEVTLRNPVSRVKVADPQKLQAKTVKPVKPVNMGNKGRKQGLDYNDTSYQRLPMKPQDFIDKIIYRNEETPAVIAPDGQIRNFGTGVPIVAKSGQDSYVRMANPTSKPNLKQQRTLDELQVRMSKFPSGDPSLQKTQNLPFNGDLYRDYVAPTIIARNLTGIELKPEAYAKFSDVAKEVENIIKTASDGVMAVKFFETMTDNQNHPVAGAQWLNVINVALNERALENNTIQETAYHEMWHALRRAGAFTDKELEIFDNKTDLLKDYMLKDSYLKNEDFNELMKTPEGREELQANAFGKFMAESRKDPAYLSKVPPAFRQAFLKLKRFLERLANALRRRGFNSLDDIFTRAQNGEAFRDALEDLNYTSRMVRYQRLADATQDALNAEKAQSYENRVEEARKATEQATIKSGKSIGVYSQWLSSFANEASNNPFVAQIYDSVRRRMDNSSLLLNKYIDTLGDFQRLDKAVRYRLHDLADHIRSTGRKSYLDDQGRLVFERNGQIVKLDDVAASQQYMNLQASYGEVLNDYEFEIKRKARDAVPELPENFTLEDISAVELGLGEDASKTKLNVLNNLKEALSGIANMRKKDFVPHMRFGNSGVTVRDKETGEQVAFYTVEADGRKLFDKYQMDEMIKDIKAKYGDSSKYEVIGRDGVVAEIDKVVPFKLTYTTLQNAIDPRFLNIELLSGLLNSRDMDINEYKQMRDAVYSDILTRGFNKRFEQSGNIGGYSKDWDRVMHGYFSGASHYLSGLPQQEELATLSKETAKLTDEKLKSKLNKYIEYTGSPAEDYLALRQLNFLWTMGGNLSTAALQLMTLPTTTLGNMAMYNPNIIQNMNTISKWTKIGLDIGADGLKTINLKDGSLYINFGDDGVLRKMVESKKISPLAARYIKKMSDLGRIRGLITEDSAGYKPFETRSLGGSIKGKLSNVANLLGVPVSAAEQITRFGTTMAAFDMLESNPAAVRRAEKVLAKDYRFQAQVANNPNMSFNEHVASFITDEAHAVFGKIGRPEIMRGLGGSLFIPFMTYPHQLLEWMYRTLGKGPDGKRAVAVTLGALFMFSGLMGMPGAELLKELLEAVQKQLTGVEEDYDLLIREKIYDATGSATAAKFATQGFGRAFLGWDVARRIGVPIPGQEILMNVLGIKGDSADMLGVQGSMISGMANAWNEYNNDGSAVNVLSSLMPIAPGNVLKAMSFMDQGVKTQKGFQLVTPEEITAKTVLSKAIGITSDQIATKREEAYLAQLAGTKYGTAIERYRNRAKNKMTELRRAQRDGQDEKAKKLHAEYKSVIMDLIAFSRKNKLPLDLSSFNRSVNQAAAQRLNPTLGPKDVKKVARKDLGHIQRVLGVDDDEKE